MTHALAALAALALLACAAPALAAAPLFLRPGAAPLAKRIVARAFRVVRGGFEQALRERRCRMTDHFAGFAITGRYTSSDVAALIG